jgi:threonine aldolase
MNFCSDNAAGASPAVMESLVKANDGHAMPYGSDPLTLGVEDKIREIFECDADIFLVSTGTAANALALSAMTPSWGAVFCHKAAHIEVDECGAPEFFTGGAKLTHLDNENGKITAGGIQAGWDGNEKTVHQVQPKVVSITQASEAGTIYQLDDIRAISAKCRELGLLLHMDGARFANALTSLDCTPAEMTWKAGIDVLSFGGSKNGCMAAEAVVLFNRDLAENFAFRRKRAGHLFSKMRFISAQFDAYLNDDLWLDNARHANAMAARLHDGLASIKGASFETPVEANELFVDLPAAVVDGLEADGFQFYRWGDHTGTLIRLVTAFNTKDGDVDRFIQSAKKYA